MNQNIYCNFQMLFIAFIAYHFDLKFEWIWEIICAWPLGIPKVATQNKEQELSPYP